MTSRFQKVLMLGAACTMLSAGAAFAGAGSQDAAYDNRGNVPTNTWGNCVRTKWNAANDACAPKVEPKPVPVAQPAPPPPPPVAVVSQEARTIYFDFDDDNLTADSIRKLDSIAGIIRNSNGGIVRADIVGYADEMGKNDYNVALSGRRADAVRTYLSRLVNIDTQVADIRGLGESNSVTDCKKIRKRSERISCLAKDRRVEVELKYKHYR